MRNFYDVRPTVYAQCKVLVGFWVEVVEKNGETLMYTRFYYDSVPEYLQLKIVEKLVVCKDDMDVEFIRLYVGIN